MKLKTLLMLAFSTLLGSSLFAGPPDFKQVAPAPTLECPFGTGWYVALDGGANVYQDVKRTRDFAFPNGDIISLSSDSNVGGWGGIKLGYVFGTGTFRPTIEEDLFYNGVPTNFHLRLNGTEVAHSSNLINSGAFMTNFIGRFAFGKFQPYAGGGVGAYYAAASGSDITINHTGTTFSTGGGASSGSFAFEAIAGADYYWSCKWSTFVEYKFLDYMALDVGNGNKQVGQQLVGAGIRFHF
jgi:opacity protein-like surface antigen